MCGIAGIISSGQSLRHTQLTGMLDQLAHRGPDADGVWENESLSLGHRRLSIIDLSEQANQPMRDSKGNTLVFNGMIYNYKELRDELVKNGLSFQTQSDTEVLLNGYAYWGKEVLNKIEGFFAFALYDLKNNRLICARDPFGKKPFYYTQLNGQFRFASEIQSLVKGFDKKPSLNDQDLAHYLWKGFYSYTRTVYDGVYSLEPGAVLEFDLNKQQLKVETFKKNCFELGSGSDNSVFDTCDQKLSSAIDKRLQSDVPIGVLLSGGVDSSLVSLYSAAKTEIESFNISFQDQAFDESPYADQVAQKIEANHTKINVTLEGLPDLLPHLVEVYGEPFGDSSTIPTLKLFESIPSHIKVALTGDGGDEVFAGYEDVQFFNFQKCFSLIKGMGNLWGNSLPLSLSRNSVRLVRWLAYTMLLSRTNGSLMYEVLSSNGWTQHWRKQLLRPEVWARTNGAQVEEEARIKFLKSGRTDLERYLNSQLERLSQAYLMKVDRASMRYGIETRSPLLDANLFKWARGLSGNQLIDSGKPKMILKDLLNKKMKNSFADRPKQGFTPPLVHWLAEKKNKEWVKANLLDPNQFVYSLFEPAKLKEIIETKNHTDRIWTLLFLNEWHKKFN